MLVWCLLQDDGNDSEGSEDDDDDDDVDDEDEDDDGDDDMSEVFSDSEGSDSQGEDVEVCLTAKACCPGAHPQQPMLVEYLIAQIALAHGRSCVLLAYAIYLQLRPCQQDYQKCLSSIHLRIDHTD